MSILVRNWPIIAVVLLTISNWGFQIPEGPISRQNYFDLLRQIMLVLGAGVFVGRPDFIKNTMNRATGRPDEPVIPEDIKKLVPIAEVAVAKMGTSVLADSTAKKEAAQAQIEKEAVKAGLEVPGNGAALAVELAVLKAKNGK